MNRSDWSAFWAGVLTLGIEILAGRLLAPFFGSSLYQWAALIGVALVAYGVGYAFYSGLHRLGPTLPLAVGGVYVLSLPFWLYSAVEAVLGLPLWAASVAGAILAVGAPSVLWASTLPFFQKEAGPKKSARVLSWGAAGNLAGAWGIAFLAVPYLGTKTALILLGAISLALAMFWIGKARLRAKTLCLALVGLGGMLAGIYQGQASSVSQPWELVVAEAGPEVPLSRRLVTARDSGYQSIAVWDEEHLDRVRRALSLNGSLQFLWSPDERITSGLRYEYYNFSTAAAYWVKSAPAKRALILGLGGGLVPWQLRQFLPGIEIAAFELDRGVAEVAAESLPLSKAGPIDLRIGDARTLLRQDSAKYDLILLDTFLNSYVPFHLTTREFFELARARLAPGGVLIANFHTIFSTSGLLPKLEATMSSVFPSVGAFELPAGTTMVLASGEETDLASQIKRGAEAAPGELRNLSWRAAQALRGPSLAEDVGGELLTDDKNDTEQRLYETRRHVIVSRSL